MLTRTLIAILLIAARTRARVAGARPESEALIMISQYLYPRNFLSASSVDVACTKLGRSGNPIPESLFIRPSLIMQHVRRTNDRQRAAQACIRI